MASNQKNNNAENVSQLLQCVTAGVMGAFLFVAIPNQGLLGFLGIYFSQLPSAWIFFTAGAYAGNAAMGISVGLIYLLSSQNLALGGGYLIIDVLPIAMMANLMIANARKTKIALGNMVSLLCLVAALVTIFFTKTMIDMRFGENSDIQSSLVDMFKNSFTGANAANVPPQVAGIILKYIVPYLPAILAVMWIFRTVMALWIGLWVATLSKKALLAEPKYKSINISLWVGIILVLSTIISILGNGNSAYLSLIFTMVMLVPFALQGLAVVHINVDSSKHKKAILVSFYILISLVAHWAILALAILGVVELLLRMLKKPALKQGLEER